MILGRAKISGDRAREAIDALGGFVYQLYQSALAWTALADGDLLFLEVAEDYAVVAREAITAVQVKRTSAPVTINSDSVLKSIESLIVLSNINVHHEVFVRLLTTSSVGAERRIEDRVGGEPTLVAWRKLARVGDLAELRQVLAKSNLSLAAKEKIDSLGDADLREQILKRLHFDCDAPSSDALRRELRGRLSRLLTKFGGLQTQLDQCETSVIFKVLQLSAAEGERSLVREQLTAILEDATRVSISQADFDLHIRMISKVLGSALGSATTLTDLPALRNIPALPPHCLSRLEVVEQATRALKDAGRVWFQAATGLGKSMLARILAYALGGNWGGVTVRGYTEHQTAQALDAICDSLPEARLSGVVIDDLDARDSGSIEALQRLFGVADRLGVSVILTAAGSPPSKLGYLLGGTLSVVTVPEFSESEVAELVASYGGDAAMWRRYVYLAAGGGHPQLVEALVRNLAQRRWPTEELQTLDALLQGNVAVEEVRSESRRRLLRELRPDALSILERLSLYVGNFDRELVLELASVAPSIPTAGVLLDELVGPWIDQTDSTHFQLSPLLSGLGRAAMSSAVQAKMHWAIAEKTTRGSSIELSSASTAVLSALASRNVAAMFKIVTATFHASSEDLSIIAANVPTLSLFRLDKPIWPENPRLSVLLRGLQIILVRANGDNEKLSGLLSAFRMESDAVGSLDLASLTQVFVYTRLLIGRLGASALPGFPDLLAQLHEAIPVAKRIGEASGASPSDFARPDGVSIVGFAFIVQLHGLTRLSELKDVFDAVDRGTKTFRDELLQPIGLPEFEPEILVRSAWLAEHEAGTIDANAHTSLLLRLEGIVTGWSRQDIGVVFRKYAAMIRDEYGTDKDAALALIDAGLVLYGQTNSELIRAKAKIHYRAGEHADSLRLSQRIIESGEIASPVERAFLGREAAISAEREGNLGAARKYYIYARAAAQESALEDMKPMASGLLADAALAAWLSGDRETCLREYRTFLTEVAAMDPNASLRAAHVRAVGGHTILWLDQQASGQKRHIADGTEPQIYPGCVSNPEPHKQIGDYATNPIDLAWYMLAQVECDSGVNVGIADGLGSRLPSGPALEGELLLAPALIRRALARVEPREYQWALEREIGVFCYFKVNGPPTTKNVTALTYLEIPKPVPLVSGQFEGLSQLYVLLFFGYAFISGNSGAVRELLALVASSELPPKDIGFLAAVSKGDEAGNDFNCIFGRALYQEMAAADRGEQPDPTRTWLIGMNLLQVADSVGMLGVVVSRTTLWAAAVWAEILGKQRFRLNMPKLYAQGVQAALELETEQPDKLWQLLDASLGLTKINGQSEARASLEKLRQKVIASIA